MRAFEIYEDMKWSAPDMAVLMPGDQDIILFKANEEMRSALEKRDYGEMEKNIIGSISLNVSDKTGANVQSVVAEKGYGPLLYYIAMAKYGWLAPHHQDVSNEGKKIWRHFWDNPSMRRKEATNSHHEEYMSRAYALDNITNNRTQNKLRDLLEISKLFIKQFGDRENQEEKMGHIDDAADDLRSDKLRGIYG